MTAAHAAPSTLATPARVRRPRPAKWVTPVGVLLLAVVLGLAVGRFVGTQPAADADPAVDLVASLATAISQAQAIVAQRPQDVAALQALGVTATRGAALTGDASQYALAEDAFDRADALTLDHPHTLIGRANLQPRCTRSRPPRTSRCAPSRRFPGTLPRSPPWSTRRSSSATTRPRPSPCRPCWTASRHCLRSRARPTCASSRATSTARSSRCGRPRPPARTSPSTWRPSRRCAARWRWRPATSPAPAARSSAPSPYRRAAERRRRPRAGAGRRGGPGRGPRADCSPSSTGRPRHRPRRSWAISRPPPVMTPRPRTPTPWSAPPSRCRPTPARSSTSRPRSSRPTTATPPPRSAPRRPPTRRARTTSSPRPPWRGPCTPTAAPSRPRRSHATRCAWGPPTARCASAWPRCWRLRATRAPRAPRCNPSSSPEPRGPSPTATPGPPWPPSWG